MTHISFATPLACMQSGFVYEPSTADLQLLLETDDLFEDIHIAAPLGLGHVCALPHAVLRQRTLKVLRVYADCTLPDGLETLPLESLAYMSTSYQLPQSLASFAGRRDALLLNLESTSLQFIPAHLAELCFVPVHFNGLVARGYYWPRILLLVLAGRRGGPSLALEIWYMICKTYFATIVLKS